MRRLSAINRETDNPGNILTKIFLVFFGIIFLLFILEVSLRLSGGIYTKINNRQSSPLTQTKYSSGGFTILCLGDSYTYGLGTTYENNYPFQLARILERRGQGNLFSVVNLGSPGGNTWRTSKIFKESISKNKPDLVIVMAGHNNSWNMEGEPDSDLYPPLSKLEKIISGLRVYKLGLFIVSGLQDKIARLSAKNMINNTSGTEIKNPSLESRQEYGKFYDPKQQVYVPKAEWEDLARSIIEYKQTAQISLAIGRIKKLLDKYPGSCQLEKELIWLYRESGDDDAAIRYADHVIDNCCTDQNDRQYIHLQLLYSYRATRSWLAARKEIDLLLENAPAIGEVFSELRAICNNESGMNFGEEAREVRNLIDKLYGNEMVVKFSRLQYLMSHQDKLSEIISADLFGMVATAKNNGIRIILMTYPHHSLANPAIRNVAEQNRVVLIDNQSIFEGITQNERLFAADKHCNADGYKLIAENIFNTIDQAGILSYAADARTENRKEK
ncbi:MAG: SGNH/GDSL hydrolase family protein [Candidatus Omnitrophota bacterium]|nr:SGNH/GDSL hydrolase family protein [Candidatus Omnitrophota bacterium]MBU1928348.1 SGNH/GDSL hydrolase family protein [Candidatus Omnitrophota bacterium]MBU2034329.1 SGNH/GDSL hydrolase family protein [Candidatus Omnitrophota bacterium]MBU2221529.1 SGNH/GDSL hydrolase family protein [Candidatus Omnitrophota bacterium]MBU2257726.1 SGNH/GDSL hydrolase family protein [Candidatus Omnitrophota bacterium]